MMVADTRGFDFQDHPTVLMRANFSFSCLT